MDPHVVTIDQFHKSHNASVLYPKMHHFVTEMCMFTFVLQSVALWNICEMDLLRNEWCPDEDWIHCTGIYGSI